MGSRVLDASALLALLNSEPGSEVVAALLPEAVMSSVNFSEVVAKLADERRPELEIRSYLGALGLLIVEFDTELAYWAGLLRPLTKATGLSLGDRACLALAESMNVPVVTSDRAWASLSVKVELIR